MNAQRSEFEHRLREATIAKVEAELRKAVAEAETAELIRDATKKHIRIQLGLPVAKEPS